MSLRFQLSVVVCFLAICCYVLAEVANIGPCPAQVTYTDGISIDVSDCNDPNNCPLRRGTTHHVKYKFTAKNTTTGLKMNVFGKVAGVRVPYARNVNICQNTTAEDGTKCADSGGIETGKSYNSDYDFSIRTYFPKIPVPVDFQFSDGANVVLFCVQVNVTIVCGPKDKDCS